MTRSFIGDIWFDIYDSVAMLQSANAEALALEEDNALKDISTALDLHLPKWHDRLLKDLLDNLSPQDIADMLDSLESKENDDECEEE